MTLRHRLAFLALLGATVVATTASAQIDPVSRELLELGYEQPLQGHAPVGAYVFYYLNRPQFRESDRTLRLSVSPVYLDGELGIRDGLGSGTDIGIGFNGGGFAYDYDEIRSGHWFRDQSFSGHGAGAAVSIYHLFNPGKRVPLNGVLRGGVRYVAYERDSHNPETFTLPRDQPIATLRAGLRFGGIEPLLHPDVAGELSGWYEGQFRLDAGDYGFAGDRRVEPAVHMFWGRGLLVYTLPQSGHRFSLAAIAGGTVHPDRLSAYRIGGDLTLNSEFPLDLPGYYAGEFGARNFALVGGEYAVPLDAAREWHVGIGAATARIGYAPGLEQGRASRSGASIEAEYRPASKMWKTALAYGHGFDAVRGDHRGADTVTLSLEVDLRVLRYHQ